MDMRTLSDNKPIIANQHKLSIIYKFFCWCSGARLYILKQCPSEYNKFYGIGVIVFLTGLMATLSGGYAFYTVFRNLALSAAFGLFWGFIIFSIDWYIVSSLRKQQNKLKELSMAIPRFILAVLISFVVSMPLKMKLFEKEIEQQILFDQQQSKISYQDLLSKEFSDISRLEEDNSKLRAEINLKEQQRSTLFTMIVEEAEGMSPTKRVGKGPVYTEKKIEYDKIDRELNQLRENNNLAIAKNNIVIEELRSKREEVLSDAEVVNMNSDGFLARLQAMSTLNSKSRSILLTSWFIILLFITIECSPILVKLLSARGPYDDLFEAEEYIKQVEIRRIIVKTEFTEDNQIDLHRILEKERNERLFDVEKSNIQNEAVALSEINILRIEKWKQEEINKLNEEKSPITLLNNEKIEVAEDVDDKISEIFEPEEPPQIKDICIEDNVDVHDNNNLDSDNPPKNSLSEYSLHFEKEMPIN
jgi:hypothetical protein